MKQLASSLMSARLSSKKSKSSGLHDESLSFYMVVNNILLATYSIYNAITRAGKNKESCKKPEE